MADHLDPLAAYAGLCPICGHNVAINRSRVRALAVPTVLNPAYMRWYAERHAWLLHESVYVKRLHARTWAHARCSRLLDAKYSYDDQVALAGDWAAQLKAMRCEAEALHGRRVGKQRRARSKAKTINGEAST